MLSAITLSVLHFGGRTLRPKEIKLFKKGHRVRNDLLGAKSNSDPPVCMHMYLNVVSQY